MTDKKMSLVDIIQSIRALNKGKQVFLRLNDSANRLANLHGSTEHPEVVAVLTQESEVFDKMLKVIDSMNSVLNYLEAELGEVMTDVKFREIIDGGQENVDPQFVVDNVRKIISILIGAEPEEVPL